MGALLHDRAVPHYEDHIRIPDRGKAVGDHKAGTTAHQGVHCLLYLNFRAGVYAGGRFIQNQNSRIRQYDPSDRKKLFLSHGDPKDLCHPESCRSLWAMYG